MTLVPTLRAAVDVEAVVALTRDLVQIPSENPGGRESEVVSYLQDVFEEMGLGRGQIVEAVEGRRSLIVSTGDGTGDKPRLLINGHLDVVPVQPNGWRFPPFGAEVSNGRIYGRGTTDMKGGVASAIHGLKVCLDLGLTLPCEVIFHLVADEELGGELGTKVLLDRGIISADACVVAEPTNLQLCLGERGLLFAKIVTRGVPAHGSEPSLGRSAILVAASIAQVLHDNTFAGDPHPLLGTTTCNVGVISGGSGPNVVPERCELLIDRRVLPGETLESTLAGIHQRIATLELSPDEYSLEVQTFCEPSEISADNGFVSVMSDAVKAMTGKRPAITGLPFTTDARFMRNDLGIPTVVFGPGELAVAHTVDEYVEVDSLVEAASVFAGLYATFDGVDSALLPMGNQANR
jgi:succinyl-diaminopimelate desuccinylase